jgi:putative tryptophan/tyrosine transport system substrate-binding protein
MKRREFIEAFFGALVVSSGGRAQQVRKIPRIGVLWHANSAEEEAVYLGAVRRGLRDLGYVEGQNITLENRFPNEQPELFISLAAELASLNVDVLVAINRIAALAAQRATTTIPVVFVAVPNPVENKLVASLAHPGGNITGLSNMALDLTGKRLGFLKLIVSALSRPALLLNANDKVGARQYLKEAQAAASRLNIQLQAIEVRTPADLAPAFSKMRNDRIDGVVVTQDGLFYQTRQDISDLGLAHRLPVIVYSRETVFVGALAAYGPDNYGIFRRSGVYIDKILKGEKPAEMPVEEPTKFQLILNNKTASALGLTFPAIPLAQADEVIE